MRLLRLWSTRSAQHWLYLEVKKQDAWVGAYWQHEHGDWGSTLNLWVCLLPCFPLHYIRESTRERAGRSVERSEVR